MSKAGTDTGVVLIGGACKCNTRERPSKGHGLYVGKYIDLTKNRGGVRLEHPLRLSTSEGLTETWQ